jgi:hypothetical protein
MSQVNVNPDRGDREIREVRDDRDGSGATTAATRNLTWAIAAVIVIAAVAIAIVYLAQNLHPCRLAVWLAGLRHSGLLDQLQRRPAANHSEQARVLSAVEGRRGGSRGIATHLLLLSR